MPLTSRATVVLPVPGLPVNTRCRVIVGLFSPASPRSFSTRSSGDLPVDLALDPLQADQAVELGQQLLEALLRDCFGPAGRGGGHRPARPPTVGASAVWAGADRGRGATRAAVAGAARDSWAAAATEALPTTRIVGSPSWQAAEATSASARA